MIRAQPGCLLEAKFDGLETKSEANLREHWAKRRKRAKTQRSWIAGILILERYRLLEIGNSVLRGSKIRITCTRLGVRKLDSDNLAGAFKAIRDEVASWLGVDDGHEGIDWQYRQTKGDVGVVITIETR